MAEFYSKPTTGSRIKHGMTKNLNSADELVSTDVF